MRYYEAPLQWVFSWQKGIFIVNPVWIIESEKFYQQIKVENRKCCFVVNTLIQLFE